MSRIHNFLTVMSLQRSFNCLWYLIIVFYMIIDGFSVYVITCSCVHVFKGIDFKLSIQLLIDAFFNIPTSQITQLFICITCEVLTA